MIVGSDCDASHHIVAVSPPDMSFCGQNCCDPGHPHCQFKVVELDGHLGFCCDYNPDNMAQKYALPLVPTTN